MPNRRARAPVASCYIDLADFYQRRGGSLVQKALPMNEQH